MTAPLFSDLEAVTVGQFQPIINFTEELLHHHERGAFLRREGLRDGDLERWQQEALSGLGATEPPGSSRRVRELERKMIKTEKRLREATALLDLQKKVQALWGDADDDTQGS